MLQKQAVEISRATAPFTVTIPARPAAGGGRGARRTRRTRRRAGAAAGADRDAAEAPATPPPPAAADDARVPGRQLHRPHGPAVFTHRRRAARLPVLGAERRAGAALRRHRLDVPRRLRRAGGPRDRREGARRADGAREGRRQGAERRHRAPGSALRDQPQRGQRADHAALQAEGRRHPGGGGAVRVGRHEVQPRHVRHQGRVAGGPRQGDERARPEGVRARGRAVGEDASGARRADRDPALVDQHADRGLVAPGVRHLPDPVRLHRSEGDSRHRRTCARSTT